MSLDQRTLVNWHIAFIFEMLSGIIGYVCRGREWMGSAGFDSLKGTIRVNSDIKTSSATIVYDHRRGSMSKKTVEEYRVDYAVYGRYPYGERTLFVKASSPEHAQWQAEQYLGFSPDKIKVGKR